MLKNPGCIAMAVITLAAVIRMKSGAGQAPGSRAAWLAQRGCL
jgi:hypothetical protein